MAETSEVLAGLRSHEPVRLGPDTEFSPILHLVRAAFAYMEGRIDPPSSAAGLSVPVIAAQAAAGEVWMIGSPPLAVVFLTPGPGALHLGKLAVAEAARGRGLARRLVALAEERARLLGLPVLELQSRVELTGNHAAFAAMGFVQTNATAHPGYQRVTSLTFTRPVVPSGPLPVSGSA